MHGLDLILTLTGGLTAALALGYVTHRIGLSPIVGYLLAGTLVGPHTPGFVANPEIAEQLAEIGVILLMFGVGLQFHVDELLAVRRVAVPGAIAQSLAATLLGAAIVHLFGWSWSAGLVFGLALSVASTVVLIRVLSDNRDLHTRSGHIAVGWLVVEDLFTVIALVVLPAFFGGASTGSEIAVTLGVTALKLIGLAAFTFTVGTRVIPRILDHVAATRSRELFTLTVLVIALGIAVGSALLFGVSMALGAFLAGLIVGRSDFSQRAASEALPLRDAFAVLFFVSVGMLLDPRYLLEAPALIAAALAVVIVGKPLVAMLVVLALKYPFRVGLAVAVALAQIGEFSFILGALGRDLGILTADAMNTIIAVSIISIVVNPLLYRSVGPVERWISRRPALSKRLDAASRQSISTESAGPAGSERQSRRPHLDASHRAVVVGYGPTGRTVTRLLRENGIEPTVVEFNVDTVRRLKDEGIAAIYGDAKRSDILEGAGVGRAGSIILTSAGMSHSEEVIRLARGLNPTIHVLARTNYLRDLEPFRKMGADGVFSAEGEVALALTEAILHRLGATPEQVDRERARVHAELTGENGPNDRSASIPEGSA